MAEETGLSLALSETPKTGFVTTRPILSFNSVSADLLKWNLLLDMD